MNIKQTLITIATAFRRLRSRIYYDFSCFFLGYCPTSDEMKNSKIKSLASRLKAESYEETLTNILEWQERNIAFWTERHPMGTILSYTFFVGVASLIYLGALALIIRNIQLLPWLSWFIVIWLVILATTLTIMIWIIHSNRKISVKEGLKNALMPSISMNALLENNLGMCRDYAKLTACLLSNIYPDEQIYFATAPGHVATGIMIKSNLYILDQRLPILTIDKWDNYRHLEKVKRWITKNSLKPFDIFLLPSTTKTTSLDTRELAKRMTKLLNMKEQAGDKAISPLEIPWTWKKGAKLYEDNEMVNYSLARRLKMEISNELLRINQITRIKIDHDKDDLKFRFSLE
jgi:predicted transglutaminase-like protease